MASALQEDSSFGGVDVATSFPSSVRITLLGDLFSFIMELLLTR
jgi:hypothetical protein